MLESLDSAYLSYTFTDISSGFFEKAAERFKREGNKLIFKSLDVERPPADQGYARGSYDVSTIWSRVVFDSGTRKCVLTETSGCHRLKRASRDRQLT